MTSQTEQAGALARRIEEQLNQVLVGQPAIKLVKTASAINDVDGNGHDEGDKITFGFKVTNTGTLSLDPVTVEELVSGNAPLLKLLSGGAEPERDCGEVLVSAAQLI